ncbi:hypothetical protein [Labrys wisconsinensis]|uniref:DNA-binding LacI/PurR family transcriptional regulator n=1 Tax=Labrys wisconsinensis TaxID=425677 RepID=A0ABU0JJN9_9HYPH|nr:hypothetical protein [Labrys wisconsinensis]MDQ0474490.1 DNA-binding LacI/PurR family transcriptional regulator [Labrys wisconsinensis]
MKSGIIEVAHLSPASRRPRCRVLNDRGAAARISPETEEKVRAAARRSAMSRTASPRPWAPRSPLTIVAQPTKATIETRPAPASAAAHR